MGVTGGKFHAMSDGNQAQWAEIARGDRACAEQIPERMLVHLEMLTDDRHGMAVDRLSERDLWMIRHHAIFQSYYFNHFLAGDRNARERFRCPPHSGDSAEFCEPQDQRAFDPH